MIKYTIHFCYQYPGSEFLNAAGRALGDNTIRKPIAKGTAYDEDMALRECQKIIGAELEESQCPVRVGKGKSFQKRMGKSSFIVNICEVKEK